MNIPNVNGQVRLTKLIEELQGTRIWGTIEVQFQDGLPVFLKKPEMAKLFNNNGSTRYAYERR